MQKISYALRAAGVAGLMMSTGLTAGVVAGLAAGLTPAPAAAQQQGRPPQPVTVVTLQSQDVTITSMLPGRVAASSVAEVRPQVAGIITERLFEEGGEVALGAPLYRIDSEVYQAAVEAAEASVAQAEATLRGLELEEKRIQTLVDRRVGTQQDLDAAKASRDAAAAGLKAAQAQLVAARIDLKRTEIRAPLAGVIGRSLTTRGALVTNGQSSALAVIRDIDPVFVDVTQSAADLVRWKRKGGVDALDGADVTVRLFLADGEPYDQTGALTAAEPHVDEQTGVVTLRMSFANPDRLLLPGMYAQVEMPQGVVHGAVLAPMQGVSRDRRGRPTAWVVNAQNVVEARVLTLIGEQGGSWIVSEGLSDGDRIIIEGLQKTKPGATVTPEEAAKESKAGELADAETVSAG